MKNIIMAARTDDKVEFARTLGFPLAVNVRNGKLQEIVTEVTADRGVDACIEGTGESEPWAECINHVKSGGRVVCLGNPLGSMSLITHRFSLSEYEKAFSLMYERREMYCKVMFVM